jgi:hypothetical protein
MSEKFQINIVMVLFVHNGGIMGGMGLFYYDLHPKREHVFGRIKNGKMILSKTGEIATAS